MRAFDVRVSRVRRLSPHFVRFTFEDASLGDFDPTGLDQRIKLIFPLPDGSFTDVGLFEEPAPEMMTWYGRWRALPEARRNPIRTYTVRHVRPEQGQIDVDFVLHADVVGAGAGGEGPASSWASAAMPGDRLIVIGPERAPDAVVAAPGRGVEWAPGPARELLIVADETAVPAAAAVLESLGPECTGEAFLEVPTAADGLEVHTASAVTVQWLPREGESWGAQLAPAVRDWGRRRLGVGAGAGAGVDGSSAAGYELPDLPEYQGEPVLWEVAETDEAPDGDGGGAGRYAWLAGEAGAITALRRHLVKDLGISRTQVSFMGYWRHGRPGA